jgi:hypothetical protein
MGETPADLDRLLKLKSLLDSGVLTKEEFEQQKKLILHPPIAQVTVGTPTPQAIVSTPTAQPTPQATVGTLTPQATVGTPIPQATAQLQMQNNQALYQAPAPPPVGVQWQGSNVGQFRLCSNSGCQNRDFLKFDACPTCGARTGLYNNLDANQLLAAKRAPQLQMQNKQALYSAPAPPPVGVPAGVEMRTTEQEYLLGGFESGNLVAIGPGVAKGSFGYGIYVTNRRIFGMKSMKGLATGLLAIGLLPGLVAYLAVGRKDHSAEAIMELENKKNIELRKENISKIEMNRAPTFLRPRQLIITLNSGTSIKFIANKKDFQKLRDLMTAFYPEALRLEDGIFL